MKTSDLYYLKAMNCPHHHKLFGAVPHSYRDLPRLVYQVAVKFRDEARPRFGLVRGREFVMKDAYSFDADADAMAGTYESVRGAYERIGSLNGRCTGWPGIQGGRLPRTRDGPPAGVSATPVRGAQRPTAPCWFVHPFSSSP